MNKEQVWTEDKEYEMIDFQDFIDLFILRIKKGIYKLDDKRSNNGDASRFQGGENNG